MTFRERSKLESDRLLTQQGHRSDRDHARRLFFSCNKQEEQADTRNQRLCIGNNFRLGSGRRLVQIGPELSR